MTDIDVLYRAYLALYKSLSSEASASKMIEAIAVAPEPQTIAVTHKVCHVQDDWLVAIERGLVFIGRAIDENRQFIRTDGEVKPIERVRQISKQSVQHLARHSDLITREQTDEDIIPDKLYTLEKDSDYAVYENKFLYMLLCCIRNFVGVRYDAIVSAYKEYKGEYSLTKNVKTTGRRLKFSVNITDEQDDTVFVPSDMECADAIKRMDGILHSVAFYLRTPLMLEVSRASRISSNIIKTNVLINDKNFFAALKLYEYLRAYSGDGYTIEQRVESPQLNEDTLREFSVPILLSAFLTYEHGLGIEDYLREEFEKEELRRAEEEQKELQVKLQALKKRIERTGEGVEQYILMLEERNAILENSYRLLQEALAHNEKLDRQISRLQSEISLMQSQIDDLESEKQRLKDELIRVEEEYKKQIEEMQRRFEESIAELKSAHTAEIEAERKHAQEQLAEVERQAYERVNKLMVEHKNEIDKLRADNAEAIAAEKQRSQEKQSELKRAHKERIDKLVASHNSKLEAINAEHELEKGKLRAHYDGLLTDSANKIKQSGNRLAECEAKAQKALDELDAMRMTLKFTVEERDVISARLTAVRKECGLLSAADDFTTEEGFTALEHEFEALGKLLNDEWKGVKSALHKEFAYGIRATMRKRKRSKSKEYNELKDFVLAQRTESVQNAATVGDVESTNVDEADENGGGQ